MSLNLVSQSVFVTNFACANLAVKTLAAKFLFTISINAELVAKPVILGILTSISVILAFKYF